jgi:RNA polymerase sigma factor (sigma-70 family)
MSPLALSIRFLQTQPDSKLIELARAGHERAFEALVQRYRRPLLRYCRRLSVSDAAAEDALQQALLQAWVALGSSDTTVRDARAWLYRIVHNVAISNLRRPVHDSVDVDPPQGTSGADHEVERRLAVRDALAGLASLPELQRQVMLSTALEGRSHDEIADALGLSHGAVRGLIYRARATLRAAAAALTPSPLLHWAARQEVAAGGRSAGIYEAVVGGGSAGIGGLLFKGGALVVTAGALATAAGISTNDSSHRSDRHGAVGQRVKPASDRAAAGAGTGSTGLEASRVVRVSATGTGTAARHGTGDASRGGPGHRGPHRGSGSSGHAFGFVPGGGGRSPGGRGSSRASGGEHTSGGGHDGSHGSGGSDGGSGSGEHSGASGHTDRGGSSGGDHNGGSDGGSGSGERSGSSGGDHGGGGGTTTTLTATPTTAATTSGDGSGDHSDGSDGGSGGGSTTTTTVTTTTTTTTDGSGH